MADQETCIVSGKGRPIQKAKVLNGGWSKARRTKFLKALGETCNVSMAARAAGVSGAGHLYALRRRDPAFAQLWAEALASGYDRLETMLLQRALEGVNDIDVAALAAESDAESDAQAAERGSDAAGQDGACHTASGVPRRGVRRSDVQLALALLNRRREGDTRQRRGKTPLTSEEVDALLLQKLDSLARKLRPAR